MEFLSLAFVFLVIIILLRLHRPLSVAILGGLAAACVCWRISPLEVLRAAAGILMEWKTLSLLVSIYLITYLQRMLERRGQIKAAGLDLEGMFHSRRVNAAVAPVFIGLLPSAAAMLLCADIVREATEGVLTRVEQAVVTSWYRHIPESTLPTYTGVLLMISISGVPLRGFLPAMAVPMLALALIGLPLLLRVPRSSGASYGEGQGMRGHAVRLFSHLWTLMLLMFLILAFGIQLVPALAVVIALGLAVYRFSPREAAGLVVPAWETRLLLNTFLVLVMRDVLAMSGILAGIPGLLASFPLPDWMFFALLFFLGGIVTGASGIVALGAPLAFASGPDMPLVVLLLCMAHAASQVSPTHICLVVASEFFKVNLGDVIFRSLPMAGIFAAVSVGWYLLLKVFIGA